MAVALAFIAGAASAQIKPGHSYSPGGDASSILAGPIINGANGHSYYLLKPMTWEESEAAAVSHGGHLVTINDADENRWVVKTFAHYGGANLPLWIGLTDKGVEGAFMWISGQSFDYANWNKASGEPNNSGGAGYEEDYVYIIQENSGNPTVLPTFWNDAPNNGASVFSPLYGVMEIDHPIDPSPQNPATTVLPEPNPSPSINVPGVIERPGHAPFSMVLVKGTTSEVDVPKYQKREKPNNFAVVIGVEQYASLPPAQFADRDAAAMRAHLVALGYPMRNIFFLNSPQATKAKISQALNSWLPNRVGQNSTVFFYFSGHGSPNPKTNQTYLVGMDGDPEDLESTAYPVKTLYAKLGDLKVRQVIVALDSCFSGSGGRSVLPKGTRPLVIQIDMGIVPEKLIILTASDKNQITGTLDEQEHGAFTYYLLKGLNGAGRDGSGKVTVRSVYDYMVPKVQDAARLQNRDQTPQLLPADSRRTEFRLR